MNYRRGFRRVYAVLTVAWIGVIAVMSIQDRPKPPLDLSEYGTVTPANAAPPDSIPTFDQFVQQDNKVSDMKALAKKYGGTFTPDYDAIAEKVKRDNPSSSPSDSKKPWENDPIVKPAVSAESNVDRKLEIAEKKQAQAAAQYPRERLQYWAACSSVAFGVPAVGFLFLFLIAPWVYRGFKAAA